MYIDNKKKYILVFGKGPTQELNDTTITVDAKYSIEYSRSQNKFCLVVSIMEATIFYSLMPQKCINSKQEPLISNHIHSF